MATDKTLDEIQLTEKQTTIQLNNNVKIVKYADDTICWYKDNKLHKENGPAVECDNGDKYWYKNGKLHRDNGPAVEYADGTQCWFQNGKPQFCVLDKESIASFWEDWL